MITVIKRDGHTVISSEAIAEATERPHYQVLQGIDNMLNVANRYHDPIRRDFIEGEKPSDAPGPKRCFFLTKKGALAYAERLRGPIRVELRRKLEKAFGEVEG
jgi:phage regulator Rha-like protein